jgi:hypothetical protein
MLCVERIFLTDPVCAGMTRKEEARIQEYESFLQNPKTQKVVIFLHTSAFSFASIASNILIFLHSLFLLLLPAFYLPTFSFLPMLPAAYPCSALIYICRQQILFHLCF